METHVAPSLDGGFSSYQPLAAQQSSKGWPRWITIVAAVAIVGLIAAFVVQMNIAVSNRHQIDSLRAANSGLQSQVTKAHANLRAVQSALESARGDLATAQSDLAEARSEASSARSDADQAQSDLSYAEQAVTAGQQCVYWLAKGAVAGIKGDYFTGNYDMDTAKPYCNTLSNYTTGGSGNF